MYTIPLFRSDHDRYSASGLAPSPTPQIASGGGTWKLPLVLI
jgi:hypothetical protein